MQSMQIQWLTRLTVEKVPESIWVWQKVLLVPANSWKLMLYIYIYYCCKKDVTLQTVVFYHSNRYSLALMDSSVYQRLAFIVEDGNTHTLGPPSCPLPFSVPYIGRKDTGPQAPFVLWMQQLSERTSVYVCARLCACVCVTTNMQPVDQPKAAAR